MIVNNQKKRIIITILIILAITVLSASASIPVIKVEEEKGSVGSTISLNVTLSETPDGLAGYNISVSLENPDAGQIMSVGFPEWASLHSNSSLPSDSVWIMATDLNKKVQNSTLNIILATLSVRIDTNEGMVFLTTVKSMDDDKGNEIIFHPAPDITTKVESSSSSGGGGGGGSSGENYSNLEVTEKYDLPIYMDKVTSYRFTNSRNPIIYVNITGNVSTEIITGFVESLKSTSTLVASPAPGLVYKNANIWIGTKGFAIPKNIRKGVVTFRVETSWINSNNLEDSDIKLLRWDGTEWATLETTRKIEDDVYTYFESNTNYFSPFAIAGLKEEAQTVTPGQTATMLPATPAATTVQSAESEFAINWGIIIVIIVIGMVVVFFVIKKPRKMEKN
jgi:PGF-pre-PGF domain-containing protein